MNTFIKSNYLLLFIVLIGLLLRLLFLNISPPSLNEDEAALGYNAFSILKTGADEHGKSFPLVLESFGDWKLPVYVYLDILPVALLGLSEFSTRIPSILAGIGGIILTYFIAQHLFKKKAISLFSALFYALSPWGVYFSRSAYEVNLATTIFLGGLLLFLYAVAAKKRKQLFIFSGILFGLTLFTYHSYIIFSPLFVAFLCSYFYKEKKNLLLLIAPFILMFSISLYTNLGSGGSKASTTTIFTNKNIIYNRAENFKKDTLQNPPLFDKIYTKYTGVPYQVLQNYFSSFSPTFLFDRGGEKLKHNLDGFGNLYIFDALLLFAGLAGLFYFKEKNVSLLAAWLLLAPIPSAITLDAPNSTRLFILMPLFVLVSGYGAWTLFILLRKNTYTKIVFGLLCFAFFINVLYFLNLYFIHFGYHRARFWHYGYKEAVLVSQKYKNKKVIMRGPENFPYIYFLFYNKYDPARFQKEAVYYPTTWDGFRYVKSFGKYEFLDNIDYGKEASNVLYIDDRGFQNPATTIRLPNGDPILQWELGK